MVFPRDAGPLRAGPPGTRIKGCSSKGLLEAEDAVLELEEEPLEEEAEETDEAAEEDDPPTVLHQSFQARRVVGPTMGVS